jgi:hypothetical protein
LRTSDFVAYSANLVGSTENERRRYMFTELTEELLDLEATAKGYGGGALYANTDPGGSCCSGCSALCIIICTVNCHICW